MLSGKKQKLIRTSAYRYEDELQCEKVDKDWSVVVRSFAGGTGHNCCRMAKYDDIRGAHAATSCTRGIALSCAGKQR